MGYGVVGELFELTYLYVIPLEAYEGGSGLGRNDEW